jgi:hypothetical protein
MIMLNDTDIDGIYMNYDGPLNVQIISTFAKFMSENTIAPMHVRKKLYRVFIELTQNVALYSFERVQLTTGPATGKGNIYVINKPNEFKCVTINKIQDEHAPILIENCAAINATPNNALRAKKNNLRKLAHIQDTGAHIGLIMIHMYSESPIDFEIIDKKDDGLYFKVAASISKFLSLKDEADEKVES